MADSDIVIPTEINEIVSERATLWHKFDEAQSQFNQIEKFASQVTSSTPAQVPSELTSDRTPPDEVAVALQNFQAELARISKGKEGIKTYQAEIKKVENQQLITMIVVGVVIAIVLCVVIFR